ncbi:MAG: hypothetical protein UIH99_02450 [Alphaproteobacteria bacterium]|nr:hypothetical protein [Alphaproteobacteria bacterium]
MHDFIDKLIHNLNLTSYQGNRIKTNYEKYDVTKLQKRGGVLYAPYVVHGFWGRLSVVVLGRQADLIGKDRTLLRAQRNIKFFARGYHSVKVGKYTYYANELGHVVSKNEFMKNK